MHEIHLVDVRREVQRGWRICVGNDPRRFLITRKPEYRGDVGLYIDIDPDPVVQQLTIRNGAFIQRAGRGFWILAPTGSLERPTMAYSLQPGEPRWHIGFLWGAAAALLAAILINQFW